MKRPVVLFSNGLGDHVLAMPALRALSHAFAGRLTLLCSSGAPRFLFEGLPLERLVAIDFRKENQTKEFDVPAAVAALGACDAFVSLVPWSSRSLKALVEALPGAASVGLSGEFQVQVARDPSHHMADVIFRVARAVAHDARLEDFAFPLELPPAYSRGGPHRILAVHAETSAPKMWAPERLAAVLDCFLASHPEFIACIVGQAAVPLPPLAQGRRLVSCVGAPLPVSFALVAQADLFLGVDSCMLHVADLCRVPGVGLFGPTRARNWGFRFGAGIAIQAEGSMQGIERGAVSRALEALLDDPGRSEVWRAGNPRPVQALG